MGTSVRRTRLNAHAVAFPGTGSNAHAAPTASLVLASRTITRADPPATANIPSLRGCQHTSCAGPAHPCVIGRGDPTRGMSHKSPTAVTTATSPAGVAATAATAGGAAFIAAATAASPGGYTVGVCAVRVDAASSRTTPRTTSQRRTAPPPPAEITSTASSSSSPSPSPSPSAATTATAIDLTGFAPCASIVRSNASSRSYARAHPSPLARNRNEMK
jgi:hypothetical protein